jgi:hypothetical protein
VRHAGFKVKRPLRSLLLAFALVLVGALAIGLATWVYAGSATAHPGNTCNPPAGHGTPGCHAEAATTTAPAPTTTTAKPTTTTAKPTATTAKTTVTTAKGSTPTTEAGTATTGTTSVTTASSTGTTGATTSSVPPATSVPTTSPAATTSSTPTTSPVPMAASTPAADSETASDPSAPVLFVDQNNCLSCHGDPSLTKQQPDGTSVSLYVDAAGLSHTVHRFQDCTACHTSEPHEVQTPLNKMSLAQKCGSCHQYEYNQYVDSVHGMSQPNGNGDAATCVDCHSATSNPHNVVRVADPSASTYPKNVAQTCAKCHDNPQLMGKYGIVEKVYETYMRSFHGKAMELASDKVAIEQLSTATCVNCHGSHNIKLVTDPTSPVAGMENLAKTCEQCHPGAGPEFVSGFLGHKEADPGFVPQVFWGEKFFYWFTRAVLAGGVGLVAMPVGRMFIDRTRGKNGNNGENEGEDEPPESKEE